MLAVAKEPEQPYTLSVIEILGGRSQGTKNHVSGTVQGLYSHPKVAKRIQVKTGRKWRAEEARRCHRRLMGLKKGTT